MIQVDYRQGSGEFTPILKAYNLPVITVPAPGLMFGDMAFLGQGEGGCPVPVGVERKTVKDLLNSSMKGRMTYQLEGMLKCYQDIWLVIEGIYRRGEMGIAEIPGWDLKKKQKTWEPLEIGSQRFMYREIESLILTLEERGGARVRKTRDKQETGGFIADLYHWWTAKTLDEHKSHLRMRANEADTALLVKPSLCRQVAALLPGIGWKKSGLVAGHFETVEVMCMAPAHEWEKIPGIGKTMAMRIQLAIKTGATL